MGHAHHFLERLDRVPRELVDLALALYRDEELLGYVVFYAEVPEGVDRLAISLDDPDVGPFLVVTRDGHFVTCLARGMKPHGLYVLTRDRFDAFVARVKDLRSREKLARRLVPAGHTTAYLFGLVARRGEAIGREEFLGISAWQPFLMIEFALALSESLEAMLHLRETLLIYRGLAKISGSGRYRAKVEDLLHKYWRELNANGHRLVLATMGRDDWVPLWAKPIFEGSAMNLTLSRMAMTEHHMGLALRGAWSAAKVGGPLVAMYEQALFENDSDEARFDAVLALTAIAIRNEQFEGHVRRTLARFEHADIDPRCTALRDRLVASAKYVLNDPASAAARTAEYGRLLAASRGLGGVNDEDARLFVTNHDGRMNAVHDGLLAAPLALATVARAAPEELYFPTDKLPWIRAPYDADRVRELLDRKGWPSDPVENAPPPTPAPKKQGRNDPCACGSGKKFKKCCG